MTNKGRMTTVPSSVAFAPDDELLPLSPRSIVLSVLLGSHPPQMPVGRILDFTSLFDLSPGAVRTALSRMVAVDDLINDDGTYRLTDRLLARQAQQDAGRSDPPGDWDGAWWTLAVVAERRSMSERRRLRSQAHGARLGELRPDLWLRPANVALSIELPDVIVTRGQVIAGDERRLTSQLWDLPAIEARSRRHRQVLDDAATKLEGPDERVLAEAFVALASAQRFLRVEPQLPVELTDSTTGAAARAAYGTALERFQDRLAAFFSTRRSGPDQYSRDVS